MTTRAARVLHRATITLALLLAAGNAALTAIGVLTPRAAVSLYLAVEVPLIVVALTVGVLRVRAMRRNGATWLRVHEELVGRVPAALMRAEWRSHRALWRWITRRPVGAGPGVTTLGYTRGTMALPIAFAVAALIEIVVVHLLVPWPWLRWTLLVTSVYSLLVMAGWFADRVVHPHLVTRDTFTVRAGHRVVATIERGNVRSCTPRRDFRPDTTGVVEDVLFLPGPDGTDLDIVLDRPIEVLLPAFLDHRRRVETVRRLALHVDDPAAARAALASVPVRSDRQAQLARPARTRRSATEPGTSSTVIATRR